MNTARRSLDSQGNPTQYLVRSLGALAKRAARPFFSENSASGTQAAEPVPSQDLTWNGTATDSDQNGHTIYLVHLAWKESESASPASTVTTRVRDHLIFHTP
jgi:hypothetical protein